MDPFRVSRINGDTLLNISDGYPLSSYSLATGENRPVGDMSDEVK
jgi:hypothetical protein